MKESPPLPPNFRHDSDNIIQEYQTVGTEDDKAEFTIPLGKVGFVELVFSAFSEGDKYIIEGQADGVGFTCIGGGEGKEGGESILAPRFNPWGPFPAGAEIRLHRETGTPAKDWAGGYTGYLEDEINE